MRIAGGGCILGRTDSPYRNLDGEVPLEFYIALILVLTLAAVAGVLYFYVMFLEARSRQQKRRIAELESMCAGFVEELREARVAGGLDDSRELWPEVIDEDSGYTMS